MMRKLCKVGFFRELPHGDNAGPSLQEMGGSLPYPDQVNILSYLKSGKEFITCLGLTSDVLNPSSEMIAPHVLTDGVWAWSLDLEYYVRKYYVQLPELFLHHMRENEWQVPDIDEQTLELLEI
jgi:hypothetical protein